MEYSTGDMSMLHPCLILMIALLAVSRLGAQTAANTGTEGTSAPPDTVRPDAVKLAVIGGITAGGFIYGHAVLSHLWWKGTRSPFHFEWDHDWSYALGADKLGHFFFPYLASDICRQELIWSDVDTTTSLWLASGMGLAYQTYIEVRDGFSKEWGFSWGDFTADILGAAYPVAQHYLPALRHFNFKMSFYPSESYRAGQYHAIIDDYESAYHWLSIDVHGLLPESLRDDIPALFNVAIGHSVRNLDHLGGGNHEFYLSLDWNLEALPGDGAFWKFIRHNLNFYHLPAPAVRIYPGLVWYGIHF
ncbi:MAG: hypothetical protein JWQ98_3019 [Chlorobi bacterium]|nr:hypothetical protein [Chlorobiota bacterium]